MQPKFRTGADLLPAVRAAVGPDGTVALDERTGSLVITGDAQALARAKKVIEQLDVKLRNVIIRVQRIQENELSNLGVKIDWTLSGGQWRVGVLRNAKISTGGQLEVQGQATQIVHRSSDAATQMVRVLEGDLATLTSGIKQAYSPDQFFWSRFTGPGLTGRIQTVQTGLAVRPRIVGGEVQLQLIPQATFFTGSDQKEQQYTNISTTVRIPDRGYVLIGAVNNDGASMVYETFHSIDSTTMTGNTMLLVSAEIESE